MATIKDSGTRRKFETGAVRDMQEGKGRMDLLPWCAVLRVARHFEAGAVKYGDRNWERGIPLHSFMDSAARHLAKYMDGQDDEDHLCAAAWNLLCAMWTEEKRPDLIDIPAHPSYAGGAQYGREDEAEMVQEFTFECMVDPESLRALSEQEAIEAEAQRIYDEAEDLEDLAEKLLAPGMTRGVVNAVEELLDEYELRSVQEWLRLKLNERQRPDLDELAARMKSEIMPQELVDEIEERLTPEELQELRAKLRGPEKPEPTEPPPRT